MFTASDARYAEALCSCIDPERKYIRRILHRGHCIKKGDSYIKDLRALKNVALSRVIIVDNSVLSFAAQLENGIYIPPFMGQEQDTELEKVGRFLLHIARVEDVRPYVQKFSGVRELMAEFARERAKQGRVLSSLRAQTEDE